MERLAAEDHRPRQETDEREPADDETASEAGQAAGERRLRRPRARDE